jgi:cytochrome P450 family 135
VSVHVASKPSGARSKKAVEQGALPPAPRAPQLLQTAALLREPAGFLIGCRERLGDCYRASFIGFPRLVYVARPDLIKLAFDTDKGTGLAGAARAEFMEALVGRQSLLTLDGEEWLRQRRLLGPPLHGNAIERYRRQIAEIAAARIETWPLGAPLKLRPRMQAITLEVILRIVFGLEHSERHDRLRSLLPKLLSRGAWTAWMPKRALRGLESLDRGPRALRRANPLARLIELRDEVDSLLYAEIAERRASAAEGQRSDILSVLLSAGDQSGEPMSDAELRDELITMLEAGHETTATGLAWAFERLVRHPEVLARLEGELADGSGDSDGGGDYLKAVVQECLRVRPVVVDTARVLLEPLDLDGFRIPAGWWIATAIPAVHMHPGVWADPETFRPERFLGERVPPHAWIPFGGGQRRCIGSQLALLEMEVVIAEVVRRLRLRPANTRPEPARLSHVTMVPGRQARVLAQVRPSSRARNAP